MNKQIRLNINTQYSAYISSTNGNEKQYIDKYKNEFNLIHEKFIGLEYEWYESENTTTRIKTLLNCSYQHSEFIFYWRKDEKAIMFD
jgi:hypothetical protein